MSEPKRKLPSLKPGIPKMSNSHAHDPYDELDALVREAMGLPCEGSPDEPAREPLLAARPDPFADYGGKVVSLGARMSQAALQGFSQRRH